ncbi:YfcC family protein [Staphylococcus schleiferi]|uniref:Short-chain fatty acids transporter n=1 Tax=Staphylococcus schleiferi TaxID=1295 RepID=A0A7Z7QMT7_STASC|nr:AbgT family transporter [Staphylococcus schleiferi]QGS46507.1 YfcC family protein [Mammaliicoccus fleurettii]MBF1992094.1 YfcC family protein [Staphylococcus schleiferi]MBF2037544.1 YfcC family protein [Staphylococcus schleiferi]MBF2099512.1 YfcC family protein [Staphylococcus schleiferi]MBF2101804.1 YfcC family protein [Staphylococcus schleiferi]
MPNTFVILFGLLLIVWLLSFLIPSGEFARKGAKKEVVANSFEYINQVRLNILDLFMAIPKGMVVTADLIFLVLIMGGAVAVIEKQGTFNAAVSKLVDKTGGNKYVLIITISILFGIIHGFGVSANAVIAFIPLGIILAQKLKLDAIAGVAIVYLGYYVGAVAPIFDPIALGVAQTIAKLPIFSGVMMRVYIFITIMIVTLIYLCRYVNKISKNPDDSFMGEEKFSSEIMANDAEKEIPFNLKHQLIVLCFFLTIGLFVYGSLQRGWGIQQLSALFLIDGILTAIIGRIKPNEFVSTFMEGAKNILFGALVIGFARGVTVIMEDGKFIDTIVHAVFVPLSHLSPILGAVAMFLFNLIFNLILPSGSGQAAVVMPLMTPLSDVIDVTRQTAVIAFKMGDGITNMITPVSGTLMAVLAVGGVPFGKWFKFAFPLVIYWSIIAIIFVVIAVMTNYGPF